MKDLHTHILYGIDDGCTTIEESINLLKEMKEKGIDEIILTPHYIENSKYNCNNTKKKEIFKELIDEVNKENINIRLYLGNEAYITSNLIELIKKKEISTLNYSRYLLFEFPLSQTINNSLSLDIINNLVNKGYIPILAHPERYEMFQKQPETIIEYLRAGVLLQGNFTSLFRKYNKRSEKTLKYFLKHKLITFLGSDTHHEIDFDKEKLEKKLLKLTKDKDYVEDILNNNFDKVIKNKYIEMIR